MPTPPLGTPWWAWLIAVLAVAVLTLAGVVRSTKSKQAEAAAESQSSLQIIKQTAEAIETVSKGTLSQVQNSHKENLRDSLDREFGHLGDQLKLILEAQKRHDSEISGIRKESHLTRQDISGLRERVEGNASESRRRHTALANRLDDHLGENQNPKDPPGSFFVPKNRRPQ